MCVSGGGGGGGGSGGSGGGGGGGFLSFSWEGGGLSPVRVTADCGIIYMLNEKELKLALANVCANLGARVHPQPRL